MSPRLRKRAEDAGADAVSLVNTFLAMAIDIETRRPKLSNIVGGLSGPAIRPIAVRMVYECRRAVKIPVIGMGGIATADDVLEFMIAGAPAVQVGTANFVDPFIWSKLLDRHSQLHAASSDSAGSGPRGHPRYEHTGEGMDQLLIALDVESGERALQLSSELRGIAGGFKVGSRLFTLEGPSLVRALNDQGARVFLDLKFHDIPNTVAQAVEAAVLTGAWMINVHASGGLAMMQAAARAGRDNAARAGRPAPLLIAVTVLTSMDEPSLGTIGVARPLLDQVVALARLAQDAGLRRGRGVAAGNRGDPLCLRR